MSLESGLNWLAYDSGVLTERWQLRAHAINYSILMLACLIYLVASTGTWITTVGCLPGVFTFFYSLEALSWKKMNEDESLFDLFSDLMRR